MEEFELDSGFLKNESQALRALLPKKTAFVSKYIEQPIEPLFSGPFHFKWFDFFHPIQSEKAAYFYYHCLLFTCFGLAVCAALLPATRLIAYRVGVKAASLGTCEKYPNVPRIAEGYMELVLDEDTQWHNPAVPFDKGVDKFVRRSAQLMAPELTRSILDEHQVKIAPASSWLAPTNVEVTEWIILYAFKQVHPLLDLWARTMKGNIDDGGNPCGIFYL